MNFMQNMMKYLVAYFSWSGNTRKIASQIHQLIGGDIVEIQPVNNYPDNYNDVLAIGKQEIRSGAKPELLDKLNPMDIYDRIFIGYPNWWNTFPAPVLTFLSENDFTGKTIIPFCTHGGGGIGRSIGDIKRQCPGAEIADSFSINAYSVKNSNNEVFEWINKLKISIVS